MIKRLILSFIALLLIMEGIWFIAIPEEFLKEKILSGMPRNWDLHLEGIRKGPFFNISVQRVILTVPWGKEAPAEATGLKLTIDELRAVPSLTSLLTGSVRIKIKGHIENGRIEGILGPEGIIELKGEGIRLSSLKQSILKGEGVLSLSATGHGGFIEVLFSLSDSRFEPISRWGIYIPMNLINTIRGGLIIRGRDISLESVSLSGKDIYGRLKGNIKEGYADLVLELMPEKGLNTTLALLIPRYMVSPGYFKIDIKGAL